MNIKDSWTSAFQLGQIDQAEKGSVIYDKWRTQVTSSYRYGVGEITGLTPDISPLAKKLTSPNH
jgi:hypothetical protein